MSQTRPIHPHAQTGDTSNDRFVRRTGNPVVAPADPPDGTGGAGGSARRHRVAVCVAPADLSHLTAALGPTLDVVPCASVAELSVTVRGGAAAAVVGGVPLTDRDVADLAALLVDCPTTVFAGLAVPPMASGAGPDVVDQWVSFAASRLEQAGVRGICQTAQEGDWPAVARALAAARLPDPVQRAGVAAVLGDVWFHDRMGLRGRDEAPLVRFFAAAFGPGDETVDAVAAQLGTDATTLAAWFIRRGLPGVAQYVAGARLVRAAWTGEPLSEDTITTAGWHPHPEAPARIHRAARRLRRLASCTALPASGAPPHRSAGPVLLSTYRIALVLPFHVALRQFDPARQTAG